MKRLALALLLVAASLAAAQEKKDDKKKEAHLPFNPVSNAKEGDWTVFRCTVHAPDRHEVHAQQWRIEKVGDKTIRIEQTRADAEGAQHLEVPLKDPPTVASYLQIGDESIHHLKVADEKKTVGNREFACKKLTFTTHDGERELRASVWLCADVKGSGVVAIHIEGDLVKPEGAKASADFEVAGFGTKDKAEFGKTKADLAKDIEAEKKKDQPKKDEKK